MLKSMLFCCVAGAALFSVHAAPVFVSPAFAHVVADPSEGKAGSYFRTALRVGHGCGQSPTIAVKVLLPEGLTSVRPQAKPGWDIKIETAKLAKPVDAGHGAMTDTAISAVSWTGGKLPNEHFDEFGLSLKLPEQNGPLYLKVIQSCAEGELRWEQIATPGQRVERPAAVIRVSGGKDAAPTASIGPIQIQQPFARATPAKMGGAFMTLVNTGMAGDKLVKAASPVAENVELHTHVKEGEVMRMRPVPAIEIAGHGRTALEPGSYHVMLIGLKQPLKEGASFPLTLTFEKAGSVTLNVPVVKPGGTAGSEMDHGSHGGAHKH
ncbi:DUF1775 domain-containing protein [Ferrovibrio sp.]|uniref:DUF1775 domain-containing protein n=1 Tax=Ferrovibrio sp. TaxID=1917215 RepID=UPI0025B7D819|nr:DUF1775 domain-containing protein [Ferrovibrio sp.]MBX3454910.1 DUF1775 domain-containing protein [Ferrovibrio sp.]